MAIYAQAAASWRGAPAAIDAGIRQARQLRSHERRFVAEAVHGMVRWRRRLAFALGLDEGAPEVGLYLAWLDSALGPAAEIEEELEANGLGRGELRPLDRRLAEVPDPVRRLAIGESYPDWLVELLCAERGLADTAALLSAMNRRAPLMARVNLLKNDREALIERLRAEGVEARPSSISGEGVELTTHLNAYALGAFKEGRFELQDAASQVVAEVVAPPPRGLVVDACAGAGGKTLALGARLGNQGRLLALDVSERRLKELRIRARRAGLSNVRALAVPFDGPLQGLPGGVLGAADRVLVDAPCSGIGALRRHPEARWRLELEDLVELPRKQREILDRYAPLVRPGGRLIYATCTVTRAENDAVVDGFLGAHPSFEEVPLKEVVGAARALAVGDGSRLRLEPHRHDTDGFFAAVLRRRP